MTIRYKHVEHLERRGCKIVSTPGHYIKMSRPDAPYFWYLGRNGGVYIGSKMKNLHSLPQDNVYLPLRESCFECLCLKGGEKV